MDNIKYYIDNPKHCPFCNSLLNYSWYINEITVDFKLDGDVLSLYDQFGCYGLVDSKLIDLNIENNNVKNYNDLLELVFKLRIKNIKDCRSCYRFYSKFKIMQDKNGKYEPLMNFEKCVFTSSGGNYVIQIFYLNNYTLLTREKSDMYYYLPHPIKPNYSDLQQTVDKIIKLAPLQ